MSTKLHVLTDERLAKAIRTRLGNEQMGNDYTELLPQEVTAALMELQDARTFRTRHHFKALRMP